jgi:hypothetical protein
MLKRGVDVNTTTRGNQRVLQVAAARGPASTVMILLEHGPDMNHMGEDCGVCGMLQDHDRKR